MKLLINWNDMECIIDGVEYELSGRPYFNDYCNIDEYIVCWQKSHFYRKDDIVLEQTSYNYYLIKLDKDDKIIVRWKFHEIKN